MEGWVLSKNWRPGSLIHWMRARSGKTSCGLLYRRETIPVVSLEAALAEARPCETCYRLRAREMSGR